MTISELIEKLRLQSKEGRGEYEVMMLDENGGLEAIREITHQPADGEIVLIW